LVWLWRVDSLPVVCGAGEAEGAFRGPAGGCTLVFMGNRAMRAGSLAVFVLTASAPARSQSAVPHRATLPTVPELKLSWPIAPLSFTLSSQSLPQWGLSPITLYNAEALWLKRGPVELLTFGSTTRAFELDCRLTCQPMLQHGSGVEARLSLPAVPFVQQPHAFVRYSRYQTSEVPRMGGVLHAGLAGAFDF
jgi:hypothetical protein